MKTLDEIINNSLHKKITDKVKKSEKGIKNKDMVIVATLPRYKNGKVIISEKLIDKFNLKG